MPDENGVIWLPNNNYFPNRDGHKPLYIVLHSTAGGTSAQATATYFRSTEGTTNPVSSTYIIDQQAVICQCVSENDGAWSNGYVSGKSGTSGDGVGNGYHDTWWDNGINPNLLTISIEHVKSATDNSVQLTNVQKQASFKLIRDICQRHNIPMRKADANGGITGHYALDPANRAQCPGPYPWTELFTFLGAPMATLENFPMISQLDSDTNAPYDCVAASIAAGMEYLTKQSYTSAQVKDAVYGASYQGNTNPVQYITYCAQHGIQLTAINGTDNAALIAATKQQLAEKHPVLLTEVDPYMPANSGETHVVVAYECDADSITVMDPFIDAPVTKTNQQWMNDLRSNQIWSMEKEALVLTIDQASQYFTETTPGQRWHCKQTNQDIAFGILTYYRTCSGTGLNGLSLFGLPTSAEQNVPGYKNVVVQHFERAVLAYDPQKEMDSVPGITGPCYPAHLDKFAVQSPPNQPEPPVVTVNTQAAISTIQAVTTALQSAIPALQSAAKDLEPS